MNKEYKQWLIISKIKNCIPMIKYKMTKSVISMMTSKMIKQTTKMIII
jgi:hypothetical protein